MREIGPKEVVVAADGKLQGGAVVLLESSHVLSIAQRI
jgi:hypothetical protein